ncbi:unnamed protein product [Pylaiella littoralis]
MGSRSSSFSGSSPRSSVGSGGGGGSTTNVPSGRSLGSKKVSSSSLSDPSGRGGVQGIPGVALRPAVPFGASALSKTMPNSGRGRPRGLRPRSSSSLSSRTPGSAGVNGQRPFSASAVNPSSLGRQAGSGSSSARGGGGGRSGGVNALARRRSPSANFREAEARAAEAVAPGVPVDVVVASAIKIESVMRVLIARGYVRRKLVSEVTAFSLIMERGIEVIKHPFGSKAKSKNVTVNFISRKGAMHLSWGGKSGVLLETIFGVTKGITTDALRAAVGPERAENCFSLHTGDRTIDFEVDNPWLVLLVVRALRLFLGAHYDTLPAPTFFSHLCLRPKTTARGSLSHVDSAMVWTSSDKQQTLSPSVRDHATRSTPTERVSADSGSEDSDDCGRGRRPSPWDAPGGSHGEGDSDAGSTMFDAVAAEDGMASAAAPPDPPGSDSRSARKTDKDGLPMGEFVGDVDGDKEQGGGQNRSPGGVMALFSSDVPLSGMNALGQSAGVKEEPLTASQLLATRGMSKRLTLSKKMSAANNSNTGPLKGRCFDLMALPMNPGQQERRERGASEHADPVAKRTQGMSISIGAGYELPEEKHRVRSAPEAMGGGGGGQDSERMAVVDDLNDKLQSLRKLCVPQARPGSYRPGRAPKTMAVKHMALFQGSTGSAKGGGGSRGGNSGGGLGSVTDMWGDGVRRQYQTDMVRQKDQSVEDVHKRDTARTAMLVTRTAVHRVTRKAMPSDSR